MTENLDMILTNVNKFINIDKKRSEYSMHFDELRIQIFKAIKEYDEVLTKMLKGHSIEGSYGDNLKVHMPDEFDSVFKLRLPEYKEAKIIRDRQNPGNVIIDLTALLDKIKNQTQHAKTYELLKKCIDKNNLLIVDKIQSWLKSLFDKALQSIGYEITVNGLKSKLKYKRQGPAHTIYVEKENFFYSVDFVPGFLFDEEQNVLKNIKGFWLAIPKPLKPPQPMNPSFRQSFFYQESQLITGKHSLKNVLRIMKKYRDTRSNLNNLKSYYIKTIFMMKAKEEEDKNSLYWQSPISTIVIDMFQVLEKTLIEKKLLFFWDKGCNMYEHFSEKQIDEMKKCVSNSRNCLLRGKENMDEAIRYKIYALFLTNQQLTEANIMKAISTPNNESCIKKEPTTTLPLKGDTVDGPCKILAENLKNSSIITPVTPPPTPLTPPTTTTLNRSLSKKNSNPILEITQRLETMRLNDEKMINEKIRFPIKMSANEVINSCINLLIIHSLPTTFFDSTPFQILTEQIFDGLRIEPITSNNIALHINTKYEQIKNNLKRIVDKRVLNLKIDKITYKDHIVLGIHIQLIHNNEEILLTLAIIEIDPNMTENDLKTAIDNVLQEYAIKQNQFYAIIYDNIRYPPWMNIGAERSSSSSIYEHQASGSDETIYYEFDESVTLANSLRFVNVIHLKSAENVLQLIVHDFFDQIDKKILKFARDAVQFSNSRDIQSTMKEHNVQMPVLDHPSSWTTTYKMLNDLINVKEIYCEYNLIQTDQWTTNEWQLIKELFGTLKPVYELKMKLEKPTTPQQLLFGDFYKLWLETTLQLKDMSSDMSRLLLNSIEKQQDSLIENPMAYAALYLDPRLKRLISKQKIEAGKLHLKKLFIQLDQVSCQNLDAIADGGNSSSRSSSFSILREKMKDLELENALSSDNDDDEDEPNDGIKKAFAEIDNYREQRMDIDANLLDYWNSKQNEFPTLQKLAFILHAIPMRHSSLERSLSAMKFFIHSNSCGQKQTNKDDLKALLLLKFNPALFS